MQQGDIFWVDFGEPRGAEAGFRRPALIVQNDEFNESRIPTTICIPLTTNLRRANLPGTALLKRADTGLDRDCLAESSLITAIDKLAADEWAGRIKSTKLEAVFFALDLVLGR